MFSATGNINSTGSRQAADQSPHSRAGVPGGSDVRVVQHGVAKSAHGSLRSGFRLGENIDQPVSRKRIGDIADTEPYALERIKHRSGINRVAHDGMPNDEGARRRSRIAK